MRRILALALVLALPQMAQADRIAAASRVVAVTLYPQGAEVTREVRAQVPAGRHSLLVSDLPAGVPAQTLRLAPGEGLALGGHALRSGRLSPRDLPDSPERTAAKAALEAAEAAERTARTALAAVEARVEAAEAQVAFLRAAKPEAATPEALAALTATLGEQMLAARTAALAAAPDLHAARTALSNAERASADARAALDALARSDGDYATLDLAVAAAQAVEAVLRVTHMVPDAGWRPVYDLRLDRAGAGASVMLDRGALVWQASGEDWAGVAVTLSTARPAEGAAPADLWPDLRRIRPEGRPADDTRRGAGAMMESAPMPAPAPEIAAMPVQDGEVLVYRYPEPADLATGVEDLRLSLGPLPLSARIEARAVPRHDATAFLVAHVTNTGDEIILPGTAFLLRGGVLVGQRDLGLLAPGMEAEIAFGPIDGLRLKREMPQRAEGDRGLLSSSREREEVAVMTVENLTDEAWPVRLIDQVPYSEQEDLKIAFTADPPPTQTDVEGRRGILAWDFDLAPGAARQVRLAHSLRWPAGMVLE